MYSRLSVVVLALCALLVACGGGGGAAGSSLPPSVGATPTAAPTPTPTAQVGLTQQGTPVPAPSAATLTDLVTNDAAATAYIQTLVSAIPTPTPPTSQVAVAGVIVTASATTLTISTTDSAASSGPTALGSNMSLPSMLTVALSSSTKVDSPNGSADLMSGVPVIAFGTLSSSTLTAAGITPLTSATIAQGERRASHFELSRSAVYNKVQVLQRTVESPRRPAATQSSQSVTFSEVRGIPGINNIYSGTIPVGSCTTIAFSVNVVAGLGSSYTWPMNISAAESSAIGIGTTGIVALTASPVTPSAPNFVFNDGAGIVLSGSVSSCLILNGAPFSFPAPSFGQVLSVNDTLPATLGSDDVIDTGTDPLGVTCMTVGAIPMPQQIQKIIGDIDVQICPHITLSNGQLTFASFSGNGAQVLSSPAPLTPTLNLSVIPARTPGFSITANSPSYSYQETKGLDVDLVVRGLTVKAITFNIPTFAVTPSSQATGLTWTLDDSTPSPSSSPSPSPSSSPSPSPSPSPSLSSTVIISGCGGLCLIQSPYSTASAMNMGSYASAGVTSLALDSSNNVYALACGTACGSGTVGNAVLKFVPPYTGSPAATIPLPSTATGHLTIDSSGDIFVGNGLGPFQASTILVFNASTGGLTRTITLPGAQYVPESLAVNPNGDLIVGSGTSAVLIYAPPYTGSPIIASASGQYANYVAVDTQGNIFTAYGGSPGGVFRFAPPYTSPALQLSTLSNPTGIAVNGIGTVAVSSENTACSNCGNAWLFSPPGYTAQSISTNGTGTPMSIAIDADGNVFALLDTISTQPGGSAIWSLGIYSPPYTGPAKTISAVGNGGSVSLVIP